MGALKDDEELPVGAGSDGALDELVDDEEELEGSSGGRGAPEPGRNLKPA